MADIVISNKHKEMGFWTTLHCFILSVCYFKPAQGQDVMLVDLFQHVLTIGLVHKVLPTYEF